MATPPIAAPIRVPFLSESRDDCTAAAPGNAAMPSEIARSEMMSRGAGVTGRR
jgi:hypothetical protein